MTCEVIKFFIISIKLKSEYTNSLIITIIPIVLAKLHTLLRKIPISQNIQTCNHKLQGQNSERKGIIINKAKSVFWGVINVCNR